jgi:hypothetical protein
MYTQSEEEIPSKLKVVNVFRSKNIINKTLYVIFITIFIGDQFGDFKIKQFNEEKL